MKLSAVKFEGIISNINAKNNGSLGLRISTPKLTSTHKATIIDLQGVTCDVFVKLADEEIEDVVTISTPLKNKSPSERYRNLLWVYWKQKGEKGVFQHFYERFMIKELKKLKLK